MNHRRFQPGSFFVEDLRLNLDIPDEIINLIVDSVDAYIFEALGLRPNFSRPIR